MRTSSSSCTAWVSQTRSLCTHTGLLTGECIAILETGDTSAPFARLGQQLNLPQTAVLSLQAPERVPLLEEEAYQWWDSFDALGESASTPPSSSLQCTRALSHGANHDWHCP